MIKTEQITFSGTDFIYTYSDAGFKIKNQNGEIYDEAYDLVEMPRTYTETDIPIKPEEEKTPEELLEIITGEAGEKS